MLKCLRIATVITLVLHASHIGAFKLSFPELNSTTGATPITWDPEGSTCAALTIQHRCLPDMYSTTKILVSAKTKTMHIPVDWLVRLIKNGTFHCQTVAQCEDNFPNVATLASIDVYLGSNSKGQATFGSIGPNGETGSSSFSNAFSTSGTSTKSNSPTNPAQTDSAGQTKDTAPVGAIVGGVIGGVAALLIAGFLLFCWRRKARRAESEKERLPIESPEPPPLPTPFLEPAPPTSPTSPSHSSPRSGERYLVDTESVPPKARMRAGLDYMPSVEAPPSSVGPPSTSGRTESASGEDEDTRRQLLHLSTRVMQLEASRGENETVPPPRYSMGA